MEYGITDLLRLIGALALFLFGMKLMSESLQKAAGDKMRAVLAAMTSNRFKGILTGLLITAIVQSSSATTVMLVSFVNAGLISLVQSIGVVMGANIGTTVTAWLISILGFKVKMGQLVLPLLAFTLPLLFSKDRKKSTWGGVIIGFAIIFIGLDFLKGSTPDIKNNPSLLEFISRFSDMGYGSIFIYLGIGTLLTIIIQSSSAVMAITLVMCFNGWLTFEVAAAMVLGENIGTTITANLAALVGNTSAKRTARAHFMFNIIGVILVIVLFYPFLNFIEYITIKAGFASPYPNVTNTLQQTAEAIPVALSIFHSVFNISATFLLVWFVPYIEKAVIYITPQKEEDEEFKLKYINTGILSTSELSILQAKKETLLYAEHIKKMMKHVMCLTTHTNFKKIHKLLEKTNKLEEISDRMEEEIANYLTHITEESLSTKGTEDINLILYTISHLEDIGDVCNSISKTVDRKIQQKIELNSDTNEGLNILFKFAEQQIDQILISLSESKLKNLQTIKQINKDLHAEMDKIRNEHYKNLRKKEYKCKAGIIYSDLYSNIVEIGSIAYDINSMVYNVNEVLN